MSQLVCIGLSYKTAPVEIREQAAIAAASQIQLLQQVATGQLPGVDEFAILSTCNRTELYAVGEPEIASQTLLRLWQEHSVLADHDLHTYTVCLTGEVCIQHLFNVAAGLESQVVGEPQILGQVIEAYERARSHNATGAVLSTLFQQAIQTGKRVRHETELGHGALSISSVAATHSNTILGSLEQANVLIIGAGEMARSAAASFVRRGIDHLSIANHTLDHAKELADQWGGQVVPFTQLSAALIAADLVITAAASPHALLNISDLEVILPQRSDRPLIIFDIALPRNVDPEVGTLPGVQLYNLDDLQAVTDAHYSVRQTTIPYAEAIVAEEIQGFA
ncbi:MAG: glutamyl-tRNA reductase, partial [Chloroflexota bacterium]